MRRCVEAVLCAYKGRGGHDHVGALSSCTPALRPLAEHGRTVPTIDQPPLFMDEPFDLGKHTVAYEARYVKALFSKVA